MIKKLYKYILFFSIIVTCFYTDSFSQNNDNSNNFEIDEIKIKFKNKKTFEESDIINLLGSKEGEIFEVGIYLLDVERIKKFYFDNGFFNTVVDTNLIYDLEDKEIIEEFIITEKKRYTYYKIDYIGIDSIDQIVREKILRPKDNLLRQGSFYSKDSIKLEVERIINILNNNGYATAYSNSPEVLKYETDEPSLKNRVNVRLIFVPKLRYEFGTTSISFSDKRYNITKEDILRELTYNENQIYDKEEVVNSELNLSKISLIENPRIKIERVDSANKKVYLVINAVIRNKYDLTPEIFGYNFQNTFYLGAGLSFSDKYFFGGGRVLTSRARFYFHSFKDNRFEFINQIYQPFLFNNRNISGSWNIGAEYILNEEFNVTQIKNSFGANYDLPTYTYINSLTSKWEIKNSRVIFKKDVPATDTSIAKFDLNIFTSTLSLGAIHNSINNIQFPFKGYYQSYEIQESGLLGGLVKNWFNTATLSYIKFTNFNAAYYNLTNQEVNVSSALAAKISAGIIIEYGDNKFNVQGQEVNADRVPTEEKFVCGGSSSVRGWAAKQLGIVVDKKVGGNFIFENSVEHRLRPFLDAESSLIRDLGFATFMDLGNVWSEIGKFKLNEIAIAMGAGIRYYTIIGAIRLDIGFKIYDPQPGPVGGSNWIFDKGSNFNDKYNFQFGIGNTF